MRLHTVLFIGEPLEVENELLNFLEEKSKGRIFKQYAYTLAETKMWLERLKWDAIISESACPFLSDAHMLVRSIKRDTLFLVVSDRPTLHHSEQQTIGWDVWVSINSFANLLETLQPASEEHYLEISA